MSLKWKKCFDIVGFDFISHKHLNQLDYETKKFQICNLTIALKQNIDHDRPMMKRILLIVAILTLPLVSIAENSVLAEADALFEKRHVAGKTKQNLLAVKTLLSKELAKQLDPKQQKKKKKKKKKKKVDPFDSYISSEDDSDNNPYKSVKDFELLMRLSQINYYIGTYVYPNEDDGEEEKQARKAFKEGYLQGRALMKLNPKRPEGYYFFAINGGRYGHLQGVMQTIALISPMMDALRELSKVDKKYFYNAGYRILGRMYFKVPGIIGGSNKKAIKYLKLAAADKHGQKFFGNFTFLGDFYLDQKNYAEAYKYYSKAKQVAMLEPNKIENIREMVMINKGLKRSKK